jgi:pilus assembly protein CpaF
LSVPAARAWITGSFELVLELVRLSDGRQRVQRALELVGVGEDDFLLQDIFTFVSPPGSDKGEFVAAGTVPRVVERLMAHGYPFDTSMFKQ